MPPYTIENTPTRHKLSQEFVPTISTHGGIAGGGFYHFLPDHNRPKGLVCFKRTRIIRDPQQGAYCICAFLQYSTWLYWKVIEWEHQYIKLNNALSTALFRLRYLRLQICNGQHASQKKGKELKRELAGKCWCEWLAYSQRIYIYMLPHLCGTLIGPHGRTLALVASDKANDMWAPTEKSNDVCQKKLLGHWVPFWTQKALGLNGRKQYLISCLLQHKVIPHPLGNSGTFQKTNEGKIPQQNTFFSSSRPTAQISIPVSANKTPSELRRLVDVNQIKHIHFGRMEIFSSTGLLISLVEFRPFISMSEVEVNQWDEL
ncbi:hypothetical protein O181_056900 [Austropuccinia psidii MF-1]|uniref:Uncharacterized protein n=1 Tax=Austropuccinia psidii MF-1 TaxID=1389203 RepID=A0A9Q3E6Y8_9BASI|nr:hypothetical protein [Austropuccinia psidii MF-1]